MPKRIALGAIGVTREGKTVYPPIGTATTGEAFDFTSDELAEISALEKSSGNQLVRKLLSEGSDDTVEKTLEKMNLEELKAEAVSRGVDIGDATTKAAIKAAIEAAAEDL